MSRRDALDILGLVGQEPIITLLLMAGFSEQVTRVDLALLLCFLLFCNLFFITYFIPNIMSNWVLKWNFKLKFDI